MPERTRFSFHRTARDGGKIKIAGQVVGEIRGLTLVSLSPAPGAPSLINGEGGVPIYWRQYANHEDPNRSLASQRRLDDPKTGAGWLSLRATSTTKACTARSTYEITFRISSVGRITFHVRAWFEIPAGTQWRVTPHPDHGELDFCTFWPAGVFSPDAREPKRYQVCLVHRGKSRRRIAHHHLESPDKHRIRLGPGDRFLWALEDENPVITLGPDTRAEAGLCAYMWDAHFALRICRNGLPVLLRSDATYSASYTLGSVTRATARRLLHGARLVSVGAAADTPVYTAGLQSFRTTFRSKNLGSSSLWPWTRTVANGDSSAVGFQRDANMGRSDHYSLLIHSRSNVQARWEVTTLGPAFGEPAFRRGSRLRLRAWVRTRGFQGLVRIALRMHRIGRGNVHSLATYGLHASPVLRNARDWRELVVETRPLIPAPDRVHILLEMRGRGRVWFDDVECERLP